MSEKLIEIPGYPGYSATRDGEIFSTSSNWRGYGIRPLAQQLNSYGYPSVRLMIFKKRKRFVVHKLIAITFYGPKPSPCHQVRHLDGNKLNCHANNLRWGTAKDNALDRDLHGRTRNGFVSGTLKKGVRYKQRSAQKGQG